MKSNLLNEINLMRNHGVVIKEFFENTLITGEEDGFDFTDFFLFEGGKIMVCYEKSEKVLLVDYRYNSFQYTHLFFIELNDLRKSWCLIDHTIRLVSDIHLSHAKKAEKEHTKDRLYLWKDKVKAEIFITAYNFYFDSQKHKKGSPIFSLGI
jgi:hypothetical protein